MKKEYVSFEFELIRLAFGDVISTSGEGTDEPGVDPDDAFEGGYDINGWT